MTPFSVISPLVAVRLTAPVAPTLPIASGPAAWVTLTALNVPPSTPAVWVKLSLTFRLPLPFNVPPLKASDGVVNEAPLPSANVPPVSVTLLPDLPV